MADTNDTPAPSQSRGETTSQRFDRVDLHNGQVLVALATLNGSVGQLVDFARAKDEREREALEVERERREASAEAMARRLEAETAERRTANAWLREQAGKLVAPFPGFLAAVLGGIGILIVGYLSGRFGIPVPPVAP